MLPNFLVIGAAKSGTTSLYEYLRAHPQVFMPRVKEVDFFVAERNWQRGLPWYERQFQDAGDAVAIGEGSVGYSRDPWHAGVAERIARHLPADLKLVYLLREPIARMRSQYVHEFIERWETKPIDRALLEESRYIDTSRYAHQIEQYLEHFDRAQLLVITTDELGADRHATLSRIFRFLGVDEDWSATVVDQEFNRADQHRQGRRFVPRQVRDSLPYRAVKRVVPLEMRRFAWRFMSRSVDSKAIEVSPETERELRKRLQPDLERLRDHLGGDFHCWGLLDRVS